MIAYSSLLKSMFHLVWGMLGFEPQLKEYNFRQQEIRKLRSRSLGVEMQLCLCLCL